MESVLIEERHHEQNAEEGHHSEGQHHAGGAEQPVCVYPEVQQWFRLPELEEHHGHHQNGAHRHGDEHRRRAPALQGALRHAVHDQTETAGGQEEPGQIETARIHLFVVVEKQGTEDDSGGTDGDVHIEDPPPRQVGHEQAAEHGAERGRQCGGDHQDARGAHPLRRREDPEKHGHPDRGHEAPGRPLEHPEHDELTEAGGRPAQSRGGGEQHHRRQQDLPSAEAVPEPA